MLKERARRTGELLQLQKALGEYEKKHKAVLQSGSPKPKGQAGRPKQSGGLPASWGRPKTIETLKKKQLESIARSTGARALSKRKESLGRC